MENPYDREVYSPWAVMRGDEIYFLGMAKDEKDTWTIALGWPDEDEIHDAKSRGLYAIPVEIGPAPLSRSRSAKSIS